MRQDRPRVDQRQNVTPESASRLYRCLGVGSRGSVNSASSRFKCTLALWPCCFGRHRQIDELGVERQRQAAQAQQDGATRAWRQRGLADETGIDAAPAGLKEDRPAGRQPRCGCDLLLGRHGHAVHFRHVMTGHRIGWRRRRGRGGSRLRPSRSGCRGPRGRRGRGVRDPRLRSGLGRGDRRGGHRHRHGGVRCRLGIDRFRLGGRLAGRKGDRGSGSEDQISHVTSSCKEGRRRGSIQHAFN